MCGPWKGEGCCQTSSVAVLAHSVLTFAFPGASAVGTGVTHSRALQALAQPHVQRMCSCSEQ